MIARTGTTHPVCLSRCTHRLLPIHTASFCPTALLAPYRCNHPIRARRIRPSTSSSQLPTLGDSGCTQHSRGIRKCLHVQQGIGQAGASHTADPIVESGEAYLHLLPKLLTRHSTGIVLMHSPQLARRRFHAVCRLSLQTFRR